MSRAPASAAVAAAVAVAARHGVVVEGPVVLHDASNTLVHLRPAPVVGRVATTTGTVRQGDAWLLRELAVAGTLAAAGAPVVAPAAQLPPGPHVQDGLTMSFWRYERQTQAPEDLAPAGAALRRCHTLLAAAAPVLATPYEGAIVELWPHLPPLSGGPAGFTTEESRLLQGWCGHVAAELARRAPSVQPVHGDAHFGNLLHTARGPLWNDWEDTFTGPREWDLACSQANVRVFGAATLQSDGFLEGYGTGDVDQGLLDLLVDARVLQGAIWGAIMARTRGERAGAGAVVARALAWLRERRPG